MASCLNVENLLNNSSQYVQIKKRAGMRVFY